MTPSSDRINPDKLLEWVKKNDTAVSKKRGRLKLFFGAVAGVGKTYAMLMDARQKLADGVDVVVGVVETHNRSETALLTEGLPRLEPREMYYNGLILKEFDLESALIRKPQLILMDELAHTNVVGCRHQKRWQDVEELLENGIDVYTTMNVQHLESLNDQVRHISSITVHETVPDVVFEGVDEIVLIDLPSDRLLERLDAGKIYPAQGAKEQAKKHFFQKQTLVALRELALRQTAEKVDAEGDDLTLLSGQKEMQLHHKILVCIGHDVLSVKVIRHAKRISNRLKCPWFGVYVETVRHDYLSDKEKLAVDRHLRLAARLGAETFRLRGVSASKAILDYANDRGITQIFVGQTQQSSFSRFMWGSLPRQLMESGHTFEITAITDARLSKKTSHWGVLFQSVQKPSYYTLALVILVMVTVASLPLRSLTNSHNITLIYITAVVVIAARLGTGASIMASFISVAAFDFFFTQPYYSLNFHDTGYVFTFVIMLLTSLIVGSLASQLAFGGQQARKRELETHIFFELSRQLSSLGDKQKILETAHDYLEQAFKMQVIFMLSDTPSADTPSQNKAYFYPQLQENPALKEDTLMRWVLKNGQMAGHSTDTMPSSQGVYLPLMVEKTVLGVLGVVPSPSSLLLNTSHIRQLETFASLIASSLKRVDSTDEAKQAVVESEREKLRNMLLSSLSHDLRTPLASISGLSSSLLMAQLNLPETACQNLTAIYEQSSRLTKIVNNLLDVSSLESGKINLNKQPYFLEEIIGSTLNHLKDTLKEFPVHVDLGQPRLLNIDGVLIEQVFTNLLENARKYAGKGAEIYIDWVDNPHYLEIRVHDTGQGIPKKDIPHIFRKFYKGKNGGLGLGLSICKAIITAHGGHMWADNTLKTGGACFHFTLPKTALISETQE